jgi:hypothetical protein
MRIWTEIVTDLLALLWNALKSEKGIELLDELAQALNIPDPFPDVQGFSGGPAPTTQPTSQPAGQPAPVQSVAQAIAADAAAIFGSATGFKG